MGYKRASERNRSQENSHQVGTTPPDPPAQKKSRVDICTEHLERYNSNHEMLDRIIAIDETWLKYYDPKDYWASR